MPHKILVVDDAPPMVELLQSALSDAGYSTGSATSGEEALKKIQRSRPDLIVLDLALPGISGFSVLEELRSDSATSSIPIVMITGVPGAIPRLTGLEMGADAYFNKPFEMSELVSRVKDLLDHRPPQQQELFGIN